jgi:hypothetical protein
MPGLRRNRILPMLHPPAVENFRCVGTAHAIVSILFIGRIGREIAFLE